MLLKADLKRIAENRLKDSSILLQNKRYNAAIYLAGYAIELILKLRICHIFKFNQGFPEDETEFATCKVAAANQPSLFSTSITKLKQIKNHNLPDLLKYSGKEQIILNTCPNEWANIISWGPHQRYSVKIVRKAAAVEFINHCKTILRNL